MDNPPDNLPPDYQGRMDKECPKCGALHFSNEENSSKKYSLCCYDGKIALQADPVFPQELQTLFRGITEESKEFLRNARSYNNSLALASMNCNIDSQYLRTYPYCFRIHGQVYHMSSTLHVPDGHVANYNQIYIFDTERARQERNRQSEQYRLNNMILYSLHELLERINPYVRSFKMMFEVEQAENNHSATNDRPSRMVYMHIRADRDLDLRRYNEAICNEVAAVFTTEDGYPPSCLQHEIVVHPKVGTEIEGDFGAISSNGCYRINRINPNCEPMSYPLLFPNGERGFRHNIPHAVIRGRGRDMTTPMQYYSYRFQLRKSEFPKFHLAKKLFLQYVVDCYTKIEGLRLDYVRYNQADLRVDLYCGLQDAIHQNGVDVNSPEYDSSRRTGRKFILPSSFPGSPRAMQQNFQDAMAIVREYGKPDLFVTLTCNPQWPEIKENLFRNQSAQDRPDLIDRVFHLKLKELLHDLKENECLGKITALVYTIEFQKRGLPHAHILIILDSNSKIRDQTHVDKIVSAEIPHPIDEPKFYEAVASFMIHGPCGIDFPDCPCMKDNICSKNFPKQFSEETIVGEDSYPKYRRRQTSNRVVKNGIELDNQWVVPHNKYLLLKYHAHINVEVCASIRSVKYIYKYVYKGYDAARVEIVNPHDEILNYVTGRYVGSTEGFWRIFTYPMHYQSHSIVRLAVHLPNEQQVYFQEGEEAAAIERARLRSTTLTAWFKLNTTDANARAYRYMEIPQYYTWDQSRSTWKRRERSARTIGRMYFVSPREQDRFFLRILLLHVPGATSFEYLRTYDRTTYRTFREAAIAAGLVESDEEWGTVLLEGSSYHFPSSLRELFVTICLYCQPGDPKALFEQFVREMSEDYSRSYSADVALNMCLQDIDQQFREMNARNSIFGLPDPDYEMYEPSETLSPDIPDVELNDQQKEIFSAVIDTLEDPWTDNRAFFVDGPGGSGKTTLYKAICAELLRRNIKFLCVATTGIAATLLPFGRTAHSTFKLPLILNESSVSLMSYQSPDAQIIRDAQLILWDEATMASGYMVKCASECVADMCDSSEFFGNKVVVFGGDFRQCLPVTKGATRSQIVESTLKKSPFWPRFRLYTLTRNMRALEDAPYCQYILAIGNGERRGIPDPSIVVLPNDITTNRNIIDEVFGSGTDAYTPENMANKCILSPKNDDILELNEQILSRVPGGGRVYLSSDKVDADDGDDPTVYPTEYLNSITPSGMPPHRLNLKIGCIVVLLRNLNPSKGLCNGTRLKVISFRDRSILCSPLLEPNKRVFLPRIELAPTDSGVPFTLRRRQFPIRLAYAMTINKSQGQTFDKVGLYLPNPVFAHGQLYVALSRVRRQQDIKVFLRPTRGQGPLTRHPNIIITRNVVYTEVLH